MTQSDILATTDCHQVFHQTNYSRGFHARIRHVGHVQCFQQQEMHQLIRRPLPVLFPCP